MPLEPTVGASALRWAWATIPPRLHTEMLTTGRLAGLDEYAAPFFSAADASQLGLAKPRSREGCQKQCAREPPCLGHVWRETAGVCLLIQVRRRPANATAACQADAARCTGVLSADGGVCCAPSCGACGGSDCAERPGGRHLCCRATIRSTAICCDEPGAAAPCVVRQKTASRAT